MREIKFRVWDKEEKVFFKPIYEAFKGHLLDLSIGLGGDILRRTLSMPAEHESNFPDKYEIMQFTGLQDKNGVDIYEGDQLYICAGYSSIVEFQDGMFVSVYSHPEDGEALPLSDAIGKDTIVIGNIYENGK